VCIFVAAVRFLPSSCLATTGGYIYRHTDSWEAFKKYAAEMSSDAMIFINIGSAIQKLIREGYKDTEIDSIEIA
jgi:hypothetical protein